MQAQSRAAGDYRRRALAALLVCILGAAVFGAARSGQSHKHVARSVAVLAAGGADTVQMLPRGDQHGAVAVPGVARPTVAGRFRTSDSSPSASSHTAQPPQVRGPPAKAPA